MFYTGAAPGADPQRDATLPDVLPNNKPDDPASTVLTPAPAGPSAPGFRDSLYKPLVPPCDAPLEKTADGD